MSNAFNLSIIKKLLASGLALGGIFFASCSGPQGLQGSNLAYLYDPGDLALQSHLKVVHLNDSLSRLYYRFNSSDLLYVRDNDQDQYLARFRISYQLVPSFKNNSVLDSNQFNFEDRVRRPQEKVISGYFDFKTPQGAGAENQALLYVKFSDLERGSSFRNFERIRKRNLHQDQNFRLSNPQEELLYKPHLPPGIPFSIEHSQKKVEQFFVSVYDREFPLALPPYASARSSSFEIEPDTTYKISARRWIKLPHPGFYHFRTDTSQWDGFTVYSFYPEFPLVGNYENLAEPLRYLTTKDEYQQLLDVMDQPKELKKRIDKFWLERAGSIERSKLLISAYYKRVEEANRLFSSYMEGWKTDRGIIYTIYGPPNKVYRGMDGESWVYGNESSSLSYIFNFLKVDNPFSENDYELERMPQYRYGWGQAIEAWRNGHIYNSKDIRREQDAQDQLQYRTGAPYWN